MAGKNYKSPITGPIHLRLGPRDKACPLSFLSREKTRGSLEQWPSKQFNGSVSAKMVT